MSITSKSFCRVESLTASFTYPHVGATSCGRGPRPFSQTLTHQVEPRRRGFFDLNSCPLLNRPFTLYDRCSVATVWLGRSSVELGHTSRAYGKPGTGREKNLSPFFSPHIRRQFRVELIMQNISSLHILTTVFGCLDVLKIFFIGSGTDSTNFFSTSYFFSTYFFKNSS